MNEEPVAPKGKPWLGLIGVGVLAIAGAIASFEEGTVYHAYPDPASGGAPWTICVGHTEGVYKGETATQAQCDAFLKEDELQANRVVKECIHVPLNVNQEAALTDAVFNLGPSVVCGGSSVQRAANARDYPGMCANLARYIYASHHVMRGLINRRVNEIELCNWPVAQK